MCLSGRRSSCTHPSRCLQFESCPSDAAPGLSSEMAGSVGLSEPHGSRESPPWNHRMTTPRFRKHVRRLIFLFLCFYTDSLHLAVGVCAFQYLRDVCYAKFKNMHCNGHNKKTNVEVTFFSPAQAFDKWLRYSQSSFNQRFPFAKGIMSKLNIEASESKPYMT